MTASFFRSALSDEVTSKLAGILQPVVTDLISLGLLTKHAHWNVRGALFVPLHEQLDELHDTISDAADDVAERQVILGHPVEGQAAAISKNATLNPLRSNFLSCQEVVEDVSNRLLALIELLRRSIEETGELDPVTQDLLIGITSELEKHLWMLQAQQL